MNQLPLPRASELSIDSASLTQWLVQGLWSDQAVGILGGEPKCCKSFLALDLAVSVASGTPCLRRFAVRRTGPVLLFPAEDSLAVVRRRLEGICSAADVDFQSLPVEVSPLQRFGWMHRKTGNGSVTPSWHANRVYSSSIL